MRTFTLVFFLSIASVSNAQVRLSLEDCIGLALKNNLNVQRAYLNAELAEQDTKISAEQWTKWIQEAKG